MMIQPFAFSCIASPPVLGPYARGLSGVGTSLASMVCLPTTQFSLSHDTRRKYSQISSNTSHVAYRQNVCPFEACDRTARSSYFSLVISSKAHVLLRTYIHKPLCVLVCEHGRERIHDSYAKYLQQINISMSICS
jgi:hypothetical protein